MKFRTQEGEDRLFLIFRGSLNPNEGLNVYKIQWMQGGEIAANLGGEIQQAAIGWPAGARSIIEFEPVGVSGAACNKRFEEYVRSRLRDKSKHRQDRPGQHPRLLSRQLRNRVAPLLEPIRERSVAVQELIETDRKRPRTRRRLHSIPQGHLFEREKQISAGLDPHGGRRNLVVATGTQE
jgi:hypothetical protein